MRNIKMLTDAYGVGGWVGLKNINAHVCLRWIRVSGVGNIQMLTDTFTVVEDGVFGLTLTKDKYNFCTVEKNTLVLKKRHRCNFYVAVTNHKQ